MADADAPAAVLTRRGGTAWVMLNRPDRLNAFNAAMHRDLRVILDSVERDRSVRALVLTGAGKAFSAGQDLTERAAMLAEGEVDLSASLQRDYNAFVRRLCALPVPVIGAVNGIAAGAGAAIAIGCDIVLAARSARFHFPFAKVALGPDSGASWLLPRLIGLPRALGLMLTAGALDAETAERWGLVWRVVDDAALTGAAAEMAAQMSALSSPALTTIRHRLRDALSLGFDAALDAEAGAQGERGRHPHYREAVSAFTEKREARFGQPLGGTSQD